MSSIRFSLLPWLGSRISPKFTLSKYPCYLAFFTDAGNERPRLFIEKPLYAPSCFYEGDDHLVAGPVAASELDDARLVTNNGLAFVGLVADFDILREGNPSSLAGLLCPLLVVDTAAESWVVDVRDCLQAQINEGASELLPE